MTDHRDLADVILDAVKAHEEKGKASDVGISVENQEDGSSNVCIRFVLNNLAEQALKTMDARHDFLKILDEEFEKEKVRQGIIAAREFLESGWNGDHSLDDACKIAMEKSKEKEKQFSENFYRTLARRLARIAANEINFKQIKT